MHVQPREIFSEQRTDACAKPQPYAMAAGLRAKAAPKNKLRVWIGLGQRKKPNL